MIISNSSPLINLSAINQFNLLKSLYKEIIIPEAVWYEVVVKGKGQPGSQELRSADWIKVEKVKNIPLLKSLFQSLGKGEAEAISLAIENKAELVLLDEKIARDSAEHFGLNYIGIIGVLREAKAKGLIRKMEKSLNDLRKIAGFWISEKFYQEILKTEGEA